MMTVNKRQIVFFYYIVALLLLSSTFRNDIAFEFLINFDWSGKYTRCNFTHCLSFGSFGFCLLF